jgi:hypothetical protein
MPSVPLTVPQLPQLAVMVFSTLENLVTLEPTMDLLLLDADLIVHSHSVVTESVIAELSLEPVSPLPSFTMKLVTLLEDHQHATPKHVPTLVETVFSPAMNNVITEVESELNPTTELNPTNAERDVFYPSAVMELLISMKNVILEPATV